MHARNRTWALGSDPAERCRQRTLPVEGGDGSTLSLDFTTGVLDPRLAFDRLSTATFINSSGLVQFANANLMTYSTPRASGSAWQTTGTVTWGSATITDPLGNATAQEVTFGTVASAIFNTSGTTVVSGITHTFSVWLRAASGTTNVRIGDANVGAVSTVTLTTTWQRFSCQYVASGTNDGGAIYSQTGTPSSTFYVWGAQVQPGSIVGELLETTGTLRRNIPRFEYDPASIGTPRGLLMEGSATNYSNYSETFPTAPASGTGWGRLEVTTNATLQTSPNGTANAIAFNETINNSIHRISHVVTAIAGALTCSVWVKVIDGSDPRRLFMNAIGLMGCGALFDIDPNVQTGASGNAVALTGAAANRAGTWVKYPNGWYRCSIVGTYNTAQTMYLQLNRASSTSATDDTYAGNTSNGLMIWGFQIEANSGASSYIPTGASTATRSRETLSMTGSPLTALMAQATNGFSMLVSWTPRFVYSLSGLTRYPSVAYLVKQNASPMSGTGAFWYQLGPYTFGFEAGNGTSALATYAPTNLPLNVSLKTAWSFTNGAQLFSTNGATVAGKSLAVTNYDMNVLAIGHGGSTTDDGSSEGTRHYLSLKFFPTALSQTTINNLTT